MTDIHDLFHDNDAPDPATTGWAGTIHARRRKTRLVTGVAAGVLAVALAVPVGIALLNQGGGSSVAEPVLAATSPAETPVAPDETPQPGDPGVLPSDPEPIRIGGAAVCQEAAQIVAGRDGQTGQPGLNEGATKAWLCGDGTFSGPLDPLTVGVDEAVEAFLAQPPAPTDQICTMEYTMAYTVVFEYANGSLTPVTGELHGCRTTNDGAGVRQGGAEFFDEVTRLWNAQRATSDFRVEEPMACGDEVSSILPVDRGQIAAVAICTRTDDGWETSAPGDNAALAGAVMESAEADAVPVDMWEARTPGRRLELGDRWGSKLVLTELKDGRFLYTDADGTATAWTPSADLAALLNLER